MRSFPVPKRSRPRITKGVVSPVRSVPLSIQRPDYSHVEQYDFEEYDANNKSVNSAEGITIWSQEEIAKIRRSCALARSILTFGGTLIKPGVTTEEIDATIHDAIVSRGAYPSPLHYEGYPKSVCTSVNEIMCHGIPDSTVLLPGDIVNLDITVFLDGFHGDCSSTFVVGAKTDQAAWHLVESTRKALAKGIEICGPGVQIKKIGRVIEEFALSNGLNVVPEFAGHGIGKIFHSPPFILHFKNDEVGVMKQEPVLCEGSVDFELWDDGWTAQSKCGGWSAQFEHTVLITESGVDVLTL